MLKMLMLTNAGTFTPLMSWITYSAAEGITNATLWEYFYTSLFKVGESCSSGMSFILPNF